MPTSTVSIRPDDPRLTWAGAVSLERTADTVRPWRLPFDDLGLFPVPALQRVAGDPAGVRLTFCSDTNRVAGQIIPQSQIGCLDLCVNGQRISSAALANRAEFAFDDLPAGDKLIEIWLPHFGEFHLRSLELSSGAGLEHFDDRRPRWITYGSSISQCHNSRRPTETWPAVVARDRDYHLTCLGYSGQCHLDVMVARLIRDLPADYLSLCLGINVHGQGSLGPRTFRPAIIGFVQVIREKHPDTPLAVISPIAASAEREERVNPVGMTLPMMREEVAAAVETLRSHGDHNLYYVDGRQIFGPADVSLLADQVHPTAEGYLLIGKRFSEELAVPLFGS